MHELDLQNLLYQQDYLKREIKNNKSYDTPIYNSIDLLSMDEFMKTAPESLKKEVNNHSLQLNRLSYEMEKRKELVESKKKLDELKDGLIKEIDETQNFLDSLHSNLDNLEESTKPIQVQFKYNLSEYESNLDACSTLPTPIYVLYSLLNHYSKINSIKLLYIDYNISFTFIENDEEQRSKAPRVDQNTIHIKDVLKMKFDESNILYFHYNKNKQYMEINGTDYLYTELFTDEINQPYLWLQYLSGLTSTIEYKKTKLNELKNFYTKISTNGILRKILLRLEGHNYLNTILLPQLKSHELNIPLNIQKYFPQQNPKCIFTEWITYPGLPTISHYNTSYFIGENYQYNLAIFKTNKFECKVIVGIPLDYPLTPSQISIVTKDNTISPNIKKCIEIEINAYYDEFLEDKDKIDYNLIIYQLRRLQVLLFFIK